MGIHTDANLSLHVDKKGDSNSKSDGRLHVLS